MKFYPRHGHLNTIHSLPWENRGYGGLMNPVLHTNGTFLDFTLLIASHTKQKIAKFMRIKF